MKDTMELHSVCNDTFPPIFYLNSASKNIINFVHKFNDSINFEDMNFRYKIGYSFDAGPNAFIMGRKNSIRC